MDELLRVNADVAIPLAELRFRATRSGGPGGQHVNTSATRVELEFDVTSSSALTEEQKALILERLGSRIDSAGVLRLAASEHRSQYRNREEAMARLAKLLEDALRVRKPRRKTKVPRAAKEARLEQKKRRSETKRKRGPVVEDD